ncbi:uncharacterized protein [Montipora capricornis]
MGKITRNDFVVVEWDTPDGQQLEAISVKKLALIDRGQADVGADVKMQYKGEIWQGQILSLHENMKSAKAAVEKEVSQTVQVDEESDGSRKRTKNKRLEGYETNHEDEQTSKKQKTTGEKTRGEATKKNGKENRTLKKKASTSEGDKDAAEKERRRIEREKANALREKERRALTERNNTLLEQMTALVSGRGSGDNFTSDVVRECVNLTSSEDANSLSMPRMPARPHNPTLQLQNTIKELQSATPRPQLTIQQLQNTLASLQGSSPGGVQPLPTMPIQPSLEAPSGSTVGESLQTNLYADIYTPSSTALPRQPGSRPTVGGKCPRRNLVLEPPGSDDEEEEVEETCESCKRLKRRVRDLENQIKQFQGQGSDPPRPGKINPVVAERFKMVELTPGSQVYIFQNLIQQAVAKPSFKSAASFLLNCFYSNDELLGMNLSGANGKPHPNKDVIESIIGFVMKEKAKSCPSASAIKIALRNKLSAMESRKARREQSI